MDISVLLHILMACERLVQQVSLVLRLFFYVLQRYYNL